MVEGQRLDVFDGVPGYFLGNTRSTGGEICNLDQAIIGYRNNPAKIMSSWCAKAPHLFQIDILQAGDLQQNPLGCSFQVFVLPDEIPWQSPIIIKRILISTNEEYFQFALIKAKDDVVDGKGRSEEIIEFGSCLQKECIMRWLGKDRNGWDK